MSAYQPWHQMNGESWKGGLPPEIPGIYPPPLFTGAPIPFDVAIVIFSKTPRTSPGWDMVFSRLMQALPGWSSDSNRLLDPEAKVPGRWLEIRAKVPNAENIDITLEYCASLRRSPSVQDFERRSDVEVILQPAKLYLESRQPGLVVFDMDSTLIQQEVIDELARMVGRYEEVAAVTEAAMRGELNFEESLQHRVKQLEGVSTSVWDLMKTKVITFTPGAHELMHAFRDMGWKTAVLSGGFMPLASWVRDTLKMDYALANELTTDASGSKLTGELLPGAPIVGPNLKKETLLKLAEENEIPLKYTVAIGDGSNDLPMIGAAGLGIAFNAKPKVQEAAPVRLNSKSMEDILYLLGFASEDLIAFRNAASASSEEE